MRGLVVLWFRLCLTRCSLRLNFFVQPSTEQVKSLSDGDLEILPSVEAISTLQALLLAIFLLAYDTAPPIPVAFEVKGPLQLFWLWT